MLKNLFRRQSPIPSELYGSVVAQSRNPCFYADMKIPDSPTGRFAILSMHLFLFSRRMVREDTNLSRSLNQEVFDLYTADIDRGLRELGVGDPTVPKRKKKMIRGFYGQVEDFAKLLDEEKNEELANAVLKRFYDDDGKSAENAKMLAGYMAHAACNLDIQANSEIMKGVLKWPEPGKFLTQWKENRKQ